MNTYRTFLTISLLVLSSGINAASYSKKGTSLNELYGDFGSYNAKRLRQMCQKAVQRESYEYDPYYDDAYYDDEIFYESQTNHVTSSHLQKIDVSHKNKKNSHKNKARRSKRHQQELHQQHQRSKKPHFQQQRSRLNVASNKIDVKKIASMSIEERTAKLHKIIKYRNDDYCCQLLEAGVDTSVTNKKGKTVLYKAVARRKYDFIEKLLQKGADPSIATNEGNAPLHKAVERDSIESVRLLLQFKAHSSVINEDGDSPLRIAVMNDCFECASELVKAGSDALLANKKGLTPLAIVRQMSNKAMILLLNAHSSSNNNIPAAAASSSSRNKKTTKKDESCLLQMQKDELNLLKASAKNDTETVQELLNMHVDPNCPTVYARERAMFGGSPLCNAVENANLALVRDLLNRKANPNILCQRFKNPNPDTPLRIAVRENTRGANYPMVIRTAMIQLLVQYGADINYGGQSEGYSRKSHTPLMILAYEKNPNMDIFQTLLDCGADINKKDFYNETALHIAAKEGNITFILRLLEMGADRTTKNTGGKKPVDLAKNFIVKGFLNKT